jgi:hypothetical protein
VEEWRQVWRAGLAPLLSMAALETLRQTLAGDDRRLIQGAPAQPSPRQDAPDQPVAAACALAFGGWVGDGLATAEEVEAHFVRLCFEADQRLGAPARPLFRHD